MTRCCSSFFLATTPGEGEQLAPLNFAPHLSRANFSFSLGSRSGIFQWLSRITGGAPDPEGPLRPEDETEDRLDEEREFLDPIQSPEEATTTQEAVSMFKNQVRRD